MSADLHIIANVFIAIVLYKMAVSLIFTTVIKAIFNTDVAKERITDARKSFKDKLEEKQKQ